MQTIFNRDGTPTIHNVLLRTLNIKSGFVDIIFDDGHYEPVEWESLYPYFISGQIAQTRCGDYLLVVGKDKKNKHDITLYNVTALEADPIKAINYNWDYTFYDDYGNRNQAYDIVAFWSPTPLCNLADIRNHEYMTLSNKITAEFDDIRLEEELI